MVFPNGMKVQVTRSSVFQGATNIIEKSEAMISINKSCAEKQALPPPQLHERLYKDQALEG